MRAEKEESGNSNFLCSKCITPFIKNSSGSRFHTILSLWLFSVLFLAACLGGIPWDLGKLLKVVWGEWDFMQN